MPRPAHLSRNSLGLAVLLAVGFAASAWGAIYFVRHTQGVSAIWPANAFLTVGLVVLERRLRGAFVATCATLLVCANMVAHGDSLALASLFTAINVGESAIGAVLFRRLCHCRLNTPLRLAKFIGLCLAPVSLLSSALAALTVALVQHGDYLLVMRQWFAACFLGSSIMAPMLLKLLRRSDREFRLSWVAVGETIFAVIVAGFMLTSSSILLRSSGIILSFPLLTAFAFRRGPGAATLMAFSIGAVTLPIVVMKGPADLVLNSSTDQRIIVVQLYVTALFLTTLATALAVREHRRMHRVLQRRNEAARRHRLAAEAASHAKSEFLATMSHEIRTPLNSIIGFTEVVLRRADLAEETHRHLTLIERAGGALLTVVNDILDFSKVEAGQVELNPRPTDISAVVEDTIAIVADSARRKGLGLDFSLEREAEGAFIADDHRLRQVLLNLLNNAIKFTETGFVRLEVTARPKLAQTILRFEVIDSGIGISPDALGQLFTRFTQADSSISRSHGGTGLGLAICKGLVELMGGQVGAESTMGAGSTFWFEIMLTPCAEVIAVADAEDDEDAVGARILLVDDHPMNRELGMTVLSLLGCNADAACDGNEAIVMARQCAYDAILMDIHMPGMDGLTATRAIRRLPGPVALTPIIGMSADVLPEQVAAMIEAGMVDSVGKPISIEALHTVLGRWVGRDATGEARAAA